MKHWDLARDYRSSLFLNIGKAFKLLFSRCFFTAEVNRNPALYWPGSSCAQSWRRKINDAVGGLTLNVESPNIAKGGGTTHVRGRRRKEHQKTAREGPHNGGRGWGGSTSGSEGARYDARTVACRRDGGDADTLCWARSRMKVMTSSLHPPVAIPSTTNRDRPLSVSSGYVRDLAGPYCFPCQASPLPRPSRNAVFGNI